MRWIAFLRAVNVGGRQVSMPVVRDVLAQAGFSDVSTYIASGNVFVTTDGRRSRERIEAEIEGVLADQFGFDVPTMARTLDEVVEALQRSGFGPDKPDGDLRRLVLFAKSPIVVPRMPHELAKSAGVIVGATERDLFVEMTAGAKVPNPAAVIEKQFGTSVTGRFGHTLHKIVAAATS